MSSLTSSRRRTRLLTGADTLSGDLPRSTTTFMRTCRQIYHEAADYLSSRGRIGVEIDGDTLRMLRLSFKPAVNASPCPGAFTYVRRLDFRIMLNLRRDLDLHEVCTTHTTMARLSKFVKHHQLDDVSILFEMHLPHDFISFQKSDMNAQLSQHRTGDLTWQHIAAFVIDPLRETKVRPGGKVIFDRPLYTPQVFQLPAFRHLTVDLAKAMRSDGQGRQLEPSDNYSKFAPYLEALQSVCDLLQTFCNRCHSKVSKIAYSEMMLYPEEELYGIRCAVVRADIEALSLHHDEYIKRVLLLLQKPGVCEPEHTNFDLGSSVQLLSNKQAVALSCALTVLALAFPQDIAEFDLGAMHVERAIMRWNMHNGSRYKEIELEPEAPSSSHNYNAYDNCRKDEIYYFSELRCGGNRDIYTTWQIQAAAE